MAVSSRGQSSSSPPARSRTKRTSFETYKVRPSLNSRGKGSAHSFRESLTLRSPNRASLDKEELAPELSVESSAMPTLVSTSSTSAATGDDPFGFGQAERQYKRAEGKQPQESPLARFGTRSRDYDHGRGPLALTSDSTTPTSTGSAGSMPGDTHPSPSASPLTLRTRSSSRKRLSDTALQTSVKTRSYSSAKNLSVSEVTSQSTRTRDVTATRSPRRSQRLQSQARQPSSTTPLPAGDDLSTEGDSRTSRNSPLSSQGDSPAHPTNIFEDDRLLSSLDQYDKLLAFDPTAVDEIPRRRTSLPTKKSSAKQRKSKERVIAKRAPGHRGRTARPMGKVGRSGATKKTEITDEESEHDRSEDDNQNRDIAEYSSKLKKQFEEIDAYELAEEEVI
ncbi:hypothetical protein IWQ62_000001 [Dispira parvispora]|uniref:Uncharacterized protein n=1 Tax=Dispira parvispora TaxID=1520584 RepID=A0A9W8E6H2_9FUNG|nr:hypothetical protein IWQ62_000001 [Dispira parvispora]